MTPTIYLGLGGTGNLAISYAKKLYEEEFGVGNIPSSVAFVTVDFQTDMDEDAGLSTDIKDDFIKIEVASNPKDFYRVRREQHGQYTWMFEGNTNNIDNRISKGAKAVRTTGRLYTEMVLETIKNRIKAKIDGIKNIDYGADVANGVNVHVVFSLAGGTGAGSFITIANVIRQEMGNSVNLYGYGVTHSIFRFMDVSGNKTPNVELNTYSAILDLDYLQTASESNPLQLEMGGRKVVLCDPIFDGFYIIDNISEHGYIVETVKSLCELVGTFLYACGPDAGELVEYIVSGMAWAGKHHVGQKLGWVQGLGGCQVVYKGQEMAETYSLKAAVELIRKIRQAAAGIHQQALNWTQEIGIREDGEEYNLLIDSIYSPKQIQNLKDPIVYAQNTDAANLETVKKYLANLIDFPTEEVLKTRTDEFKSAIDGKVEGYLLNESGVGNAIKFLTSLRSFCSKYKLEMEEEARMKNEDKANKEEEFFNRAFAEYNDHKFKFPFPWRNARNQELIEEFIARPAKNILRLVHDAKRREVARDIFIALIAHCDNQITKLTNLDKQLEQLGKDYEDKFARIQSVSPDALVFEYDLSYQERVNLEVDPESIIVSEFTKAIGKSLLDIEATEELSKTLLDYTMSLKEAREYKEKLITDVVDNLSEEDYKKLKYEIVKKSARWLKINDRGQRINGWGLPVSDAIKKNYIVSVYEPHVDYKSRLHKDTAFLQNVDQKDFWYVKKDVTKQRMLFCRIDGLVIPYCIDVFSESVADRYERVASLSMNDDMVFNPHFDKLLFEKMRNEDFKLKPEMKN